MKSVMLCATGREENVQIRVWVFTESPINLSVLAKCGVHRPGLCAFGYLCSQALAFPSESRGKDNIPVLFASHPCILSL